MQLIDVTDAAGAVVAADWLARAEPIHRQLRPQLAADYAAALQRVFAGGGRMLLATDAAAVTGVAVWRLIDNTYDGRVLYVDDLVTDTAQRSRGVGKALLDALAERARALGCRKLALDSGTQRKDAHRFYLRERFEIASFHFSRTLD